MQSALAESLSVSNIIKNDSSLSTYLSLIHICGSGR